MTSTYSPNLKLTLMGTGDQSGTWGDTTNTNLGTLVEEAIAGYTTQALAGAGPTALTIPDGASSVGRNYVIEFTGTPTAGHTVTVPAVDKPYILFNNTNIALIVKVSGQLGFTIAVGKKAIAYTNSTDLIEVANAPVTEAGTQTLTNKTLTSPVLTTPALGIPASGTLTNATGLPISTGVSGLGSGVATFLATPTYANLSTAVTGDTVVGIAATQTLTNKTLTSPVLTAPALGTPTSGTLSSCTVDGTDAVGFRNIPVNSQSAAYTLVLTDSGKCILHPSSDANARTFTIPANGSVAYPIGTAITFINMTSNVVTIAITTDTMYLSPGGTTGSRSLAQYGSATAIKITSTNWVISGSGLT